METGETELFGAGSGSNGQLGASVKENLAQFTLLPTKHLTTSRIVQVTCSHFDTTFLTSDNEVFCGGQKYGKSFRKMDIPNGAKIVYITNTFFNILLLSDTEDLYECTENSIEPTLITSGVSQVIAGGYHHITFSKSFLALLTTANNKWMLQELNGSRKSDVSKSVELVLPNNDKIERIACGWWTIYIATRKLINYCNDQ
jgi:alpha-tubulin suppressor-like RCC1 family protein